MAESLFTLYPLVYLEQIWSYDTKGRGSFPRQMRFLIPRKNKLAENSNNTREQRVKPVEEANKQGCPTINKQINIFKNWTFQIANSSVVGAVWKSLCDYKLIFATVTAIFLNKST